MLVDYASGLPAWPDALRHDRYLTGRTTVDQILQKHNAAETVPSDQEELVAAVQNLQTTLKTHMKEVRPNEYVLAKRFLERLAEGVCGRKSETQTNATKLVQAGR